MDAEPGGGPLTGRRSDKVIKKRSMTELKRLVKQYLRDRDDGVPSANGNARTAKVWADEWLETVRLTKERKTHKSYKDTWEAWLEPVLGKMLMEEIGTNHLQRCVNAAIRAGHNPTARYLVVVAKIMLRSAQRQKPPLVVYGPHNPPPWEGLQLPAASPPRTRVLSHDEVEELIEELYRFTEFKTTDGGRFAHSHRFLIRFMLETGLREAEALGLQEFQVDLRADPPRVVVAGQIDQDEEGNVIVKPYTKGKDDRTVFLSPAAVEAVKGARRQTAEYRAAAKDAWAEWALVFPSETGEPVGYRNLIRTVETVRDAIDARRKEANEPPRAHWTPHDLRRTFGTRVAQTGVTLKATKQLMGHKSEATTARIYVVAEDEEMMKGIANMKNRRQA